MNNEPGRHQTHRSCCPVTCTLHHSPLRHTIIRATITFQSYQERLFCMNISENFWQVDDCQGGVYPLDNIPLVHGSKYPLETWQRQTVPTVTAALIEYHLWTRFCDGRSSLTTLSYYSCGFCDIGERTELVMHSPQKYPIGL